jgi:hypothetical protein
MPYVRGFLRVLGRGHPDQGLPPGEPAYPDQGLPGEPAYPDQGLPPYPDQGLPTPPPGTFPPPTPTHPIVPALPDTPPGAIWPPVSPPVVWPRPPTAGTPLPTPPPTAGTPPPTAGTPLPTPPPTAGTPLPTPPPSRTFWVVAGIPGVGWRYVCVDPSLRPSHDLPSAPARPDQGLPPTATPR